MRFRSRHVHQTLVDHVKTGLTAAGWVEAPVNFGVPPVTFIEVMPETGGVAVPPNAVAISLGDEPADQDEELGAGLVSCAYPLFVDVYGVDSSIAVSIAGDVKAMLANRAIGLYDYTASPREPTTATIEFEDVQVVLPALTAAGVDKRFWRVVKAMAVLYTTDA